MPPNDGQALEPLSIADLSDEQISAVFAVALLARRKAPDSLSAEDGAALVIARRIAAKRLRWFIVYVTADDAAPYEFAPFHEAVILELERVIAGQEARLLLAAPPRHGKSRLCAILLPSFRLGSKPQSRIIIAAYSQELAREHLREVRSILLSSAFHEIFPEATLADDGMAADLLRTKIGGFCRATGSGGLLTGLGADLLVLDDLIKGHDEAASEPMRASLWAWYSMSARTRLSPEGAIVAIGTRWHHDDVLGRLVASSDDNSGEKWRHIAFPAVSAANDALWPDKFPLSSLQALKATLGQTQWQALYQGAPTAIGGGFFRADWFHPHAEGELGPERDLLTLLVSDFALSDAAGDYSVIAVLSINPEGNIFLRDLWRDRVTMDHTLSTLIRIARQWKPAIWTYESDSIMQATLPLIRQRLMQHRVNLWHIVHSRQASKVQKAGPLQGILEERGLKYPPEAPWASALIQEATEFPAGQHDDQVDALAHLGRAWLRLRPKSATPETLPPRPRSGLLHLVAANDGRMHLPLGLEDLYEAGCGPHPTNRRGARI